jgi:hypothetical protein
METAHSQGLLLGISKSHKNIHVEISNEKIIVYFEQARTEAAKWTIRWPVNHSIIYSLTHLAAESRK